MKNILGGDKDIAALEEWFTKVIAFSKEDISHTCERLKMELLGKFMGKGFPLDFVPRELNLRWNVSGQF